MTRHLLVTVLLAALCGACASPSRVAAPVNPGLAETALDAAVVQHLGSGFNGVVLADHGDGRGRLVRPYGMARAETMTATLPGTRFQIGSISKWISSVAVLRLVDQGRLQLDVPIGTYLPELPAHTAGAVTLRHLLSNTSGIPNGVMIAAKKDPAVAALPLSHLAASVRFGSDAPSFPAGSKWEYSLTNWTIVAAIVERATGMEFAAALDHLVLGPAGLRATAVPRTPFSAMPGAALAYRNKQPRELALPPHVVFVAASGTVYSTAEDLATLAGAVYETPLLSPAARAELMRIAVPEQEYALGGRVRRLTLGGQPRTVAWETGATAGFKSILAYVPGEKKTVVILNNTDLPQSDLARAAEAMLAQLYAGTSAAP
jgi:D-alanyl-D-alanine carboxypeptidase